MRDKPIQRNPGGQNLGQNTQSYEKADDTRISHIIPLYSQMPEQWRKEYENASQYVKFKRYIRNRAREIKYTYRRFLKRFEKKIAIP